MSEDLAEGLNERFSKENMGITVTQTLKEGDFQSQSQWDLPPRS